MLRSRKEIAAPPWVLPWYGWPRKSKSGSYREPRFAWERILARAELGRLVAMIGEKRAWTPEALEVKQQQAHQQVEHVRFESFARRLPKGTDPLTVVIEERRAEARKLGLDPDAARMRDLRIHDLRRTLGSWQVAQGASLSVIGRSLGHKQVQTTAIYARRNLDPVRESVERATAADKPYCSGPSAAGKAGRAAR